MMTCSVIPPPSDWTVHEKMGCWMYSKTHGDLIPGWKTGFLAHGFCDEAAEPMQP